MNRLGKLLRIFFLLIIIPSSKRNGTSNEQVTHISPTIFVNKENGIGLLARRQMMDNVVEWEKASDIRLTWLAMP